MFVCSMLLDVGFSSTLLFSKDKSTGLEKIEWPQYLMSSGLKNIQELGVSYTFFEKNMDACADSKKTYSKQAYINKDANFPLVAKTPILSDQMASHFFKERDSDALYSIKWGTDTGPLLKLYLSEESDSYYKPIVQQVIAHINQRARVYGLISGQASMVVLADQSISIAQDDCEHQLIHFEDTKVGNGLAPFYGFTFSVIDDTHAQRLGEMRDADMVIYPANIKHVRMTWDAFFVGQADEQARREILDEDVFETVLHEVMHALGVGHNFALGSMVDYSALSHAEKRNRSLEYEMAVLAYLYLNKPSRKHWPLIRSVSDQDTYEPKEKHFFKSNHWYEAQTITSSKQLSCKHVNQQNIDYTEQVSNRFKIKLNDKTGDKPYADFSSLAIEIKALIQNNVLQMKEPFSIQYSGRLLPWLRLDANPSNKVIERDGKVNDNVLLYPTPFLEAYKLNQTQSTLNLNIDMINQKAEPLQCTLKIKFKILDD